MSLENPYRAAGAFSGKAYIRREADGQLLEQIEDNQYYPYFAAPRQSGKSSLLLRTMAALDPGRYRVALVDLSPFVVTSYEDFWRQFLHEVARSANFDPAPITQEDPRDVLLLWLRSCKQRLIVFMDEIDVLLNVDCREQIFSKFRTFFNLRARLDTADLQRVQFVLAGAAHSSRFIKDPRWSPFNVAIEIELEDLSPAQVSQLAVYLATAGSFAGSDLTARVHELTGGSVFLCQLVFEQLWNLAARGKPRLDAGDVDAVVATIVGESSRNIHFYNIFRLITADARLTMLFRRLTEGQELGQEEAKELRLTGLCRGATPFRNEIYARVFGPGGPLDLKVGDRQIQLTKALDAAIARRDHLQGDPRSEPRALEVAEAEIRKLRRAFREGTQLQVGDVLGQGRFKLEEKIGQGGFAAVWRATDGRDGKDVAIKVLHGQFAEDKSRRDRFFRGAWKMSELQHPAIVRVLEPYGDENGRYYFVMEYLRGGTLHAAVQDMRMPGPQALKLLAQVGTALHFAHTRGLVHRDVKPSNVIIDGEQGKLTDFDLVREADITGGTRTGAMGTFIYAAPEVMSRPQDADARADVYGLGMTAVFALFGGDLAMDVIRDADRFIDRLPCNPVLQDVLKKAVAWDVNDRFASAAEFVAALERAAEAEPATGGKLSASESGRRRVAAVSQAPQVETERRPGPALRGAPTSAVSPGPAPQAAGLSKSAIATSAAAPVSRAPVTSPGGQAAKASAMSPGGAGATAERAAKASAAMSSPASAATASPGPVTASPENATMSPGLATLAPVAVPRAASSAAASSGSGTARVLTRGTAPYAASSEVPFPVDDEEPWDRDILVPERTDTKMLRAAVDRAEGPTARRTSKPSPAAAAAPLVAPRAPPIAWPEGHVPGAREEDARPVAAAERASSGPQAASASATMTAPQPPGERSRRPVFWMGLAASLLLVLVAQNVLRPEPLERALAVDPIADPPGPQPDHRQPPAHAAEGVTTTGPDEADATGTKPARETQAAGEGGSVAAVQSSDGAQDSAPPPSPTSPTPGGETSEPADSGKPADTGGAVDVDPPRQAPSVTAQIDAGCLQVRGGDAQRGVEVLLAAHDSKPGNIRLMLCIADGYMRLDKFESALNFYEQVLAASRRHSKALLGAAQANEALNRRTAAAELYRRVLVDDPDNRSARVFFEAEQRGKELRREPVGASGIPLTPR